MKGTWEDAVLFAMTSNQYHGKDISSDDKKRAVETVLDTFKPDFEYDSKKVVPWLMKKGFKATISKDYSKKLRQQIDDKRDAEILRLHGEGESARAIARQIGISDFTVRSVIKEEGARNGHPGEITHDQTDTTSLTATSCDAQDAPFFDESELNTAPALNPAEAFKKAVREHEEERQETTRLQNNSVSKPTKSKLEATLDDLVSHLASEGEEALLNVLRGCEVKRSLFKRLAGLV